MADYKNILIIQTAFIGDAILASSLVEKMHSRFPTAGVSILVRKGNEGIYRDHPFLKEVLIWNKQEHKLSNLLKLLFSIRRKKFDCIINCHRYGSSGFLTAFSGARHTAGYKQNPFSFLFYTAIKHVVGNHLHEIERYNQLVEDFTDGEVFKPRLYPTSNDVAAISRYQQSPYMCMAPASVWFTKQLPIEKWQELCNKLNPSIPIYLLGGPGDKNLCESIRSSSIHPSIHVLAGHLSLLASCALMQKAEMNYVNDSAPLHLASSVNAPVTAFFVSTVPAFGFGPLSSQSKIIEVKDLACRPCGLHGFKSCPLGHFKCGRLIDIGLV